MRRKIEINENWFFTKERPNLTAPDFSAMQEITLPHTWNAEDGADGDDYYDRRECWYVRKLERPQGDEIYLEVPAASQTAHVYRASHRRIFAVSDSFDGKIGRKGEYSCNCSR